MSIKIHHIQLDFASAQTDHRKRSSSSNNDEMIRKISEEKISKNSYLMMRRMTIMIRNFLATT